MYSIGSGHFLKTSETHHVNENLIFSALPIKIQLAPLRYNSLILKINTHTHTHIYIIRNVFAHTHKHT